MQVKTLVQASGLIAFVMCAGCMEGKTSSFAQAPILFGAATQEVSTAPVVEPDAANYAGLGGDALLPAAAPRPATLPTPPATQIVVSAASPLSSAPLSGAVDMGTRGEGVAVNVQTPAATLGVQLTPAASPAAAITVSPSIAAVTTPATATVAAVVNPALTTTGALLGEVNPLAAPPSAAATPAVTLINNTATTARRGACVLHIVC